LVMTFSVPPTLLGAAALGAAGEAQVRLLDAEGGRRRSP